MNTAALNIYSQGNVILQPNTFIGGVGNTITNETLLASKLSGLSAADIKLFSIDGNNNISCLIETSYLFANNAFRENQSLTYYLDIGGKADAIGNLSGSDFSFFKATNLRNFISENALLIGRQTTQDTKIKEFYLPNCDSIGSRDFRNTMSTSNLRIYLPVVTSLNSQAFYSTNYSGTILYINSAMSGSGAVLDFTSKGGTLVLVTSTTPPEAVSNLTASNITTNSVDLNFTTPTSVNGILDYDVYVDDGTNNHLQIHVKNTSILSSGSTITGLTSGTTYKIKIKAKSTFFTKSDFSNQIEITTL